MVTKKTILDKKKSAIGKMPEEPKANPVTRSRPVQLKMKLPKHDLGVKVRNLYMGEMGFGTKAYDPDAMTGLRFFFQYNGHTDITNVMMLGSMIPRVPEFYSVSGSEDMRFLAKDPTKKSSEAVELVVKRAQLQPTDIEYFREHVDGKIITKQDAVNAARVELEKIADVLTCADWHYQHGEEDRENIRIAKELMIADAAEKKRDFKQYTDKITELNGKLAKLQQQGERLGKKREFMQRLSEKLSTLEAKAGDDLRAVVDPMLDGKSKEYTVDATTKGEIRKLLNQRGITTQKLLGEAERIKAAASKLSQDEEETRQQISGYQTKIGGVKRQAEFWDFFRGTKRHKLEPDEEEIFFRLAKTGYNDTLYGVFPDAIRARSHIHSSAFNELADRLGDGTEGESTDDGESFTVVRGRGGLIYQLAHNPNVLSSNAVTGKDLKMQKEGGKRLVKLADIIKAVIPKVTLSSHGNGGFRYQPQLKHRETIAEGHERDIPEIVLHMKLPTLQSVPKLEILRTKGLRNLHTKRYNDGSYASGVVFHTVYDNGMFDVEYLDESTLRFLAGIGKAINETKASLGKKKLEAGEKAKLEAQLKEFEGVMRFTCDLTNTEADGDSHLGSANKPGRRSNYEVVDAAQRFQRQYGLPDIVVVSEAIHAPIPSVCNTSEQYWGLTPKQLEERIDEIERHPIDATVKFARLKKICLEDKHATPITNIERTLDEWKDRCLPYMLEVLKRGGRAIFVSGNHYNKAGTGRDEASALARTVPAEFDRQVERFSALGDTIGCGETTLPGGKKLYASHKLREGNDEFVNAFKQMTSQGITADLVLFFDRHHGGGGFADGTAYTLAPGRQSWSPYVDQISKLSSAAGLVNTYIPKDTRIRYVKWRWALSDCLERNFMEPRAEQTLFEPKQPEEKKK